MNLLANLLKFRKNECLLFLIIFFSSVTLHSQISENKGEGTIRITFRDWPYFPVEGDWRSMYVLGEIQEYVVHVYSDGFIKRKLSAFKLSIKEFGEPGHVISLKEKDNLGGMTTNEARAIFTPENHDNAIALFNSVGGLRIIITSPRPPYFDVPVPSGKYFLSYALGFPRTRTDRWRFVCPLYSDKSTAVDVERRWGPPSVYVGEDQIATIEFVPTPNGLGVMNSADFDWENSPTFWEYIDFLNWAGEIF